MSNADLDDFANDKPGISPRLSRLGLGPMIAWGLIVGGLSWVVPRSETIFGDFGIDLPRIAKLVINVSHHWYVVAIAAVFVLLIDWKVREELAKLKDGRVLMRFWSIGMFVLPVVLLSAIAVGLALPGFKLFMATNLSG